jgi:hypothetical protein
LPHTHTQQETFGEGVDVLVAVAEAGVAADSLFFLSLFSLDVLVVVARKVWPQILLFFFSFFSGRAGRCRRTA